MFFRKFTGVFLFVLVVVVLAGVGGAALHRAGFAQGYAAGLSGPEPDANALPLYPGYGPYHPVGYGFGLLPLLCGVGFLFLAGTFLLGGVGKMFAYRHWRRHGGPGRAGWGHRWHAYHYGGDPRKEDAPAKKDTADDSAPDEA